MTTGKLILKCNVSCDGDEEDVNIFFNSLIAITSLHGWNDSNGVYTKEFDYNQNVETEIESFNNYIESCYIANTDVYVEIKKYYKW